MDELLEDVHHGILLEDGIPDVVCDVAVGVLGVALAAVDAGAVGALVERQEEGLVPVELGGHPGFVQVHTEEGQDTTVKLETDLARVAVALPLDFGILHALPGHLVLQFEGEHRDAVHRQYHIDRLVRIPFRVVPLPIHLNPVLGIQVDGGLVQRGLRFEIAYPEGNAQVLEPVPDDADNTVADAGVMELQAKLPLGIDLVLEAEPCPRLRLRLLHEISQDAVEEAQVGAIRRRALGVAALRGKEEGFYVGFEAFFGGVDVDHMTVSTPL